MRDGKEEIKNFFTCSCKYYSIMSEDDKKTCNTFLNWVNDGGCAGWIESAAGDDAKLKKIAQIYLDIKAAFGY